MTSRSTGSVIVFPARSVMSATARVNDTATDSTPGSFVTATRTAWAHTAQSIPRIFSCTRRSSACAGLASATMNTTIAETIRDMTGLLNYLSQKK
jgi:hypothetical protein